MMSGIIPSPASFPEQESIQNVVRQVEMGSSGMMGMMGGQTMPAFPYLTEEEVAAAYLYLAQYPPRQWKLIRPTAEEGGLRINVLPFLRMSASHAHGFS
jgi:hypothetical protein